MLKYLFLSAFTIITISVWTQEGCTDPHAINYNADAQVNDGSCEYEPLIINPEVKIENLSTKVNETSGLIWFANGVWTHNDSGGEAAIYKLDSETGTIIQTVFIANGQNIDIEDIAQDDEYIYVGDFGNNYGTREDLIIYKLKKSEISEEPELSVIAEFITFKYLDQNNFNKKNRTNNFDCEAVISRGDYLYLFTKNWVNQETKCYKLPKEAGNYELDVFQQFNIRGLITGADFNLAKQNLILLGYENFIPFAWLIWDFKDDYFFGGNKKRVDFPYIQGAQTEGICFQNSEDILISCEASFYEPQVFSLNTNQIINTTGIQSTDFAPYDIALRPIPAKNLVGVFIKGLTNPDFDIELYNLSWEKVKQFSYRENNFENEVQIQIPTQHLSDGLYFIRIKQGNNMGFKKLFIKK